MKPTERPESTGGPAGAAAGAAANDAAGGGGDPRLGGAPSHDIPFQANGNADAHAASLAADDLGDHTFALQGDLAAGEIPMSDDMDWAVLDSTPKSGDAGPAGVGTEAAGHDGTVESATSAEQIDVPEVDAPSLSVLAPEAHPVPFADVEIREPDAEAASVGDIDASLLGDGSLNETAEQEPAPHVPIMPLAPEGHMVPVESLLTEATDASGPFESSAGLNVTEDHTLSPGLRRAQSSRTPDFGELSRVGEGGGEDPADGAEGPIAAIGPADPHPDPLPDYREWGPDAAVAAASTAAFASPVTMSGESDDKPIAPAAPVRAPAADVEASPSGTSPAPVASPADEARRDFLKKVAAVTIGGAIVTVPVAAGLTVLLDPLRRGGSGADVPFIKVTSLDALPDDGLPHRYQVKADRSDAWNKYRDVPIGAVYLVRRGDAITAFNVVCPHAGCFVEATPQGTHAFSCPCHRSFFNADGTQTPESVSPRGLDTLKVDPNALAKKREVWVQFRDFRAGTDQKIPVV